MLCILLIELNNAVLANQVSSLTALIDSIQKIELPLLSDDFISSYRDMLHMSSINDENKSSHPKSQKGVLEMSKFRATCLCDSSLCIYNWEIVNESLSQLIIEKLFQNSADNFSSFLDEQIIIVDSIRRYLKYYIGKYEKMNEVQSFQPIFHLFLDGFLQKIASYSISTSSATSSSTAAATTVSINMHAEPVNNTKLYKTIQIYSDDSDNTVEIRLQGYSDEGIFNDFTSTIPFQGVIELKPPLTHLHQRESCPESDQLLAEVLAFNDMIATEHQTVAYSIGSLTDLFTIQVIMKETRGHCYKTGFVCETRQYLLHLLLMLLPTDSGTLEILKKISTSENKSAFDRKEVVHSLSKEDQDKSRENRKNKRDERSSPPPRKQSKSDINDNNIEIIYIDDDLEEEYWQSVDNLKEWARSLRRKPGDLTFEMLEQHNLTV